MILPRERERRRKLARDVTRLGWALGPLLVGSLALRALPLPHLGLPAWPELPLLSSLPNEGRLVVGVLAFAIVIGVVRLARRGRDRRRARGQRLAR